MEPQQQANEDNGKTINSSGSFSCRPSSTRWTPTTDQIRILKDLYYNSGVRSPTAEQIQRIAAKLRQYGKIEGKNVFYWFQNHKARERQKKRFTTPVDDHHNNNNVIRRKYNDAWNKFPSINPAGGFPSVSAAGFLGSYSCGSVAMDRSFREYCSITPNGAAGGSMGHNFAWIGTTSHADNPNSSATACPFLEKARKYDMDHQTLELLENQHQEEQVPDIETLPLFPVFGDNLKKETRDYYFNGWQRSGEDDTLSGARASLELTLDSYSAIYPNQID